MTPVGTAVTPEQAGSGNNRNREEKGMRGRHSTLTGKYISGVQAGGCELGWELQKTCMRKKGCRAKQAVCAPVGA